MFTITEIIDIAIKIEKNGERAYRNAIEKIHDASLIRLLEWMADEEMSHMEWLFDLKQKVETTSENPFDQNMPRDMLTEIIGDQSFSLKEIDFSRIDNIDDLIDIFIEFERDGILFYEMLQPFIQSEVILSQLNQIIAEEKRHIEKLQELTKHTLAAFPQKS